MESGNIRAGSSFYGRLVANLPSDVNSFQSVGCDGIRNGKAKLRISGESLIRNAKTLGLQER